METDVIVVGSGAAGLAAAVEASERGARVVLLEKNSYLGGTTGIAIGSFTAAGTSLQRAAGIQDSAIAHDEDMAKFAAQRESRNNAALRQFFAQRAGETLDWLKAMGLEFYGPSPEPPNRVPRMHNVIPNAKAYIARMHQRALRNGVDVRVGHRVTQLIRTRGGPVEGVVAEIEKTGTTIRFEPNNGVILATGDYSNSRELKAKFTNEDLAAIEGINPTATGDGHRVAMEVGAAVVNMDVLYGPEIRFTAPPGKPFAQLLPANPWLAKIMARATNLMPRSLLSRLAKSLLVTWQHPEDNLFTQGAILVNQRGERFVNELDQPALAIPKQPGKIAYIILDGTLARRFSQWPHYISTAPDIAYAYLQDYQRLRPDIYAEAPTAALLASKIGVSPERLEATVQEYVRAAEGKTRDPFGRKQFSGGLKQPPYYALGPAKSWIVIAEGGLRINLSMEVLQENGNVIPGLYAAGSTGLGGMMLWGHGLHIAWAFTSGRLAGRHAALRQTRHGV